ncbi:hypothetical protein JTB14_021120 [Gonioctena quinquepunctata]|nr:hypothetical protein JTB14_021120 [Gonioctena quinquepunctata]
MKRNMKRKTKLQIIPEYLAERYVKIIEENVLIPLAIYIVVQRFLKSILQKIGVRSLGSSPLARRNLYFGKPINDPRKREVEDMQISRCHEVPQRIGVKSSRSFGDFQWNRERQKFFLVIMPVSIDITERTLIEFDGSKNKLYELLDNCDGTISPVKDEHKEILLAIIETKLTDKDGAITRNRQFDEWNIKFCSLSAYSEKRTDAQWQSELHILR